MKSNRLIKNITILILLISCFFAEEQGKHIRKSITTLDYVYIHDKPVFWPWKKSAGWRSIANEFDNESFDKMIDFYIGGIDRFDHNVLPKKWIAEFQKEMNSKKKFMGNAFLRKRIISNIIKEKIAPKILEILNDPEIIKQRGMALKDQASMQGFAATKAKSFGITEKELAVLMNSAYIYIPYISKIHKKDKHDLVQVKLNGGVYVWQILVDENNHVEVKQVYNAKTRGKSFTEDKRATIDNKSVWPKKFSFLNGQSWYVNPARKCQNDAMWAFTKNLNMKMRMFKPFKLRAQVVSVTGKDSYAFALGNKEGVHLDDYFNLIQPYETKKGKIKNKRVGYVRITKRADNKDNPNNYSFSKQLFGKRQSPGVIAVEYPLMGVDYRISYGERYGMAIKPEDTYIFSTNLFLDPQNTGILGEYENMEEIAEEWNSRPENKDDKILQILDPEKNKISSMKYVSFEYAYNLAPVTGKSQRFMIGNFEVGIPHLNPSEQMSNVGAMTISMYTGYKQGHGGRLSYTIENLMGFDSFIIRGTALQESGGKAFNLTSISLGYKLGVDISYMLTRRLHCYAGMSYKVIIPPWLSFQTSGSYDGDDLNDTGPDESNNEDNPYTGWNPQGEEYWDENYSKFGYSSWYQGGLNISFTLSWSIRYSKYNYWGKNDDKKKY